jgi:hypothetical protein
MILLFLLKYLNNNTFHVSVKQFLHKSAMMRAFKTMAIINEQGKPTLDDPLLTNQIVEKRVFIKIQFNLTHRISFSTSKRAKS